MNNIIPPEYLNQIVTGDARELAKRIPDESVDLVFTDPPWGIDFKYSNGYDDDSDNYSALVLWIIDQTMRILKPGGFAFVYQATKRLREMWQLFPENSRLYSSCKNFIQIKGISVEYAVDYIVFWQKDGVSSVRGMVRDWGIANTSNTSNGSRGIGFNVRTSPPRPLDSVHSIISQMCQTNGICVDFFCGSGTTCVASKKSGVNYIAFEIDPNTAERARERVRNTQPPLFVLQPEQTEMDLE